jgi:ribosomal-protein-alanine N-acetyltransferase
MAPADVPAVVAIDRLSFPTPWPASSYLYELIENRNSFYSVLARQGTDRRPHTRRRWFRWIQEVLDIPGGDEVIGYVGFRTYRGEAHITTIAVHPEWRGRGLGERLLLETMEAAVQLGAQRATLEVRQSNRVAQHMYGKYGFQFTGTRKGYYHDGEDAWLMAAHVGANGYQGTLQLLRGALTEKLLVERIHIGQAPGDAV